MSDDENPYADVPTGRIARLKHSVTHLLGEFGSADNVQLGIVINVGLALPGLAVFLATSGILSWIGAVWFLLNILPVVQWVIGL